MNTSPTRSCWPASDTEHSYRIFYGDLRTEVVSDAKFAELVPTALLD